MSSSRVLRTPLWLGMVLIAAVLAAACAGSSDSPVPAPSSTPPAVTATAAPDAPATPSPSPAATATAIPSPTPFLVHDIRATRLVIPSLGLDADVQASQTVPYVYVPEPGCPPDSDDTETVTVPNQGIASPEDSIEGLENKIWVYGHSRWLGVPGLLFGLQDLEIGDELFVDGIDRVTEETMTGRRFVVDGLYLSDVDSGDAFLTADDPSEVPAQPIVVLQTSVRERGAGRPWILDQERLLSKAQNIVEGSLDDPCKYLLLFVTASPA